MKNIPCKKCGGEAVIDQISGDNGSSFNGVQYRLECESCGHNEGEWFKSRFIAISDWETKNKIRESK
jgi:uncharacterized Zn finger protein